MNESIHFCYDHMEILSKHNDFFKAQCGLAILALLSEIFPFPDSVKYLYVSLCSAGNREFHTASVIPNDPLHKPTLVLRACSSQNSDAIHLWKKQYVRDKDLYSRRQAVKLHLKGSHFLHRKTNQETQDHVGFCRFSH